MQKLSMRELAMLGNARAWRGFSLLMAVCCVSACQTTQAPPAPAPLLQPPIATHTFTLSDERDGVIGRLQTTRAHAEDTLSDIARRFNIGYEEIARANPTVDPWLPREGTTIVLPTQFVLPDAPRSGVVINLAALRLFYFPPVKPGEPQTVITHPIGIGQVGWSTPVGKTKVVSKRADPVWYPPASVRREHAAEGEILPAKVAPGPDNPLGKYAFRLDWPSYLIHGTNQPYGVGLRASHGCVRLYPEDIAQLYDKVPVGTPVTVVNQPQVYGYEGDTIYMQSYPVLEDYAKSAKKQSAKSARPAAEQTAVKATASTSGKIAGKKSRNAKADESGKAATAAADNIADGKAAVDQALVAELLKNPNGIAVPIASAATTVDKLVAAAPRVENRVPDQATWDGVE